MYVKESHVRKLPEGVWLKIAPGVLMCLGKSDEAIFLLHRFLYLVLTLDQNFCPSCS